MIEGAEIETDGTAEDADYKQLENGFISVCGAYATDKPARNDGRQIHPQSVAKWVLQMIQRDRVRDIWAELL